MSSIPNHPALPLLKAAFPQIRFRAGSFRDMVTVVVPREHIVAVCRFLRDEPSLRYDYLAELNAVDYLGFPGAEHRFAVNYGLSSTSGSRRLWLKVFLDPVNPTTPHNAPADEEIMDKADPGLKIDSVTCVWPGAEWPEREVYDLFGIVFTGHPDLRRIFTWSGFGSYPLRKDYPLKGLGERESFKIITRDSV